MSESSSSESSSNNSSDLGLLELLSDWDSEEDNELDRIRSYGERVNYMQKYEEYEFMYRFRLNKSAVNDLLTEIYPFLKVTSKQWYLLKKHSSEYLVYLLNNILIFMCIKPLSVSVYILTNQIHTWSFQEPRNPPSSSATVDIAVYALGTMLVAVADYVGVSKSSAGRIVRDVSRAIARLYSNYIYVHNNTQEDFYNIARFPRVLGAVDGTHILMQSPTQCENGVYGNRWLLGDSAYPCKSYLLTPLLHTHSINELNYNQAQIQTRNTIERCFVVWKRRFPVLSLKIRLAMETTQAVVIATAVLHNICRQRNLEDVEPEIDIPDNNSGFQAENVPE
ncbi:Uncharacterized protein OBRU01_03520, partial [Operophtera brumata]